MRRRSAAVAVWALVSLLVGVGFAMAPQAGAGQWTPSSYNARLISLFNQTRSQHGLAVLTVAGGTSEVAAAWTSHMASGGGLAHNPDLRHQLETHGSPDWTTYGENVGDGPADNPDALFKAYMSSPEHRANILNGGYRYMGVAVVFTGSTAWNTFDFVDSYHDSSTSASKPTPRPKPTPAPTHTALQPVTAPAAPQPPAAATTQAAAPAPPHRVRPAKEHVGSRPANRHPADVRGREVARAGLAERPIRTGESATMALPRLPARIPLSPPAEVAISIAAGLVGFVGVRWAQAVARPRVALA
jgi:Cysteine-rich secretory protein family